MNNEQKNLFESAYANTDMSKSLSKDNVTMVVCSCDKYEDAWHPFFELLYQYSKDFPYPIVLNTEKKDYVDSHFNVRVIHSPKWYTWSKRLLHVLSQIDSEYIFLMLEDYFLQSTFDQGRFDKVLSYMQQNKDVGIVDISPRWAASAEDVIRNQSDNDIEDHFYIRQKEEWNITVVPSVWRKAALEQILREHEDVWQFEYYSGIRAKQANIKVARFVTRMPTIWEYEFQVWTGMGITRGQWLPKNAEFFEQHGIKVNFENLGILNVQSMDEIKQMKKSWSSLLHSAIRHIHTYLTKHKSLK